MRRFILVFFKSLSYFLNGNSSNMIIIKHIIFISCQFITLLFKFCECSTSHGNSIISILIFLCCFFSNSLNSMNKTIIISVRIIINNSHSSINLCNLFPMWHFSWAIQLDSFKLIWITILSLKLISPVLINISNLSYLYLFIIVIKSIFSN